MSKVTHKYVLKNEANYWRTEANQFHAQWKTTMEELEKYQWQPIATVPLGELVICLWGHRTIGSQIYDSQHDVKYATAKYWIPMPKFPTDNGRNS
jgi:hypothetical protein